MYRHMPRWVPFAMTTTEDGAFWGHEGLNLTLLERAIRLDLDYGRYVYGGSTITQQLVKNLYLTRSKHLARKFEELLIVWQMERLVPKRRILEVYTNGVEFGPRLYGVERASRYYFGKSVRDIGPLEAAFLGATKPCPRCGHALFKSTGWGHWWRDRTVEVLNRMRRAKQITQAQFEALYPFVPRFEGWPAARFAPNPVADLIAAMPAEKGLSVRDLLEGQATAEPP
jgi:membrane peptidoglycan carboxypeptidase